MNSLDQERELQKVIILGDQDKNISIEDILNDKLAAPLNFNSFKTFCIQHQCAEELFFYIDVQEWKKALPEERNDTFLTSIFSRFLQDDSPEQVNIPGPMFTKLRNLRVSFPQLPDDAKVSFFSSAEREVFSLIRNSVFPDFIRYVVIQKQLSTADQIGLWWRHPGGLTLSQFFTFPQAINALESRLHACCCSMLTAVLILFSVLNVPMQATAFISACLCYGYLARSLCGPRLDPQAQLIILVLRPFIEESLGWAKSDFREDAVPRRLSQCVGLLCSTIGSICWGLGVQHGSTDLNVAALSVWGMLLAFSILMGWFDFCVVCKVYGLFWRYENATNKIVSLFLLESPQQKKDNEDSSRRFLFTRKSSEKSLGVGKTVGGGGSVATTVVEVKHVPM